MIQNDIWRLGYHLMPPEGWLNDPNGLCYFDGKYHVFFQYSPNEVNGGNKCWGHYESSNLLEWQYTGISVYPDTHYERNGSYSGSAIIENGEMWLYYTGNVKKIGDYDYITKGREANTILAKLKDGTHIYEKKLLMTNKDYPEDCTCHVRDPKVWKENDIFYMVQGARKMDDSGCILLFQSENGEDFTLVKEYEKSGMGYMWECPDYFEMDNHSIMSFSPQGMASEEYRYQNQYQSGYSFVKNDEIQDFHEWDMGFDFYAPQTFLDENGRRILIAWMGMPDADYTNPTTKFNWQHCLTMPRELVCVEDRIFQKPVDEMKKLRGCKQILENRCYSGLKTFELLADSFEQLRIDDGMTLTYDQEKGVVCLSMSDAMGAGRKERKVKLDSVTKIQMYVDTSAVEIFINDGEVVMTSRYYKEAEEISLEVIGIKKGTLWNLNEMEVQM